MHKHKQNFEIFDTVVTNNKCLINLIMFGEWSQTTPCPEFYTFTHTCSLDIQTHDLL